MRNADDCLFSETIEFRVEIFNHFLTTEKMRMKYAKISTNVKMVVMTVTMKLVLFVKTKMVPFIVNAMKGILFNRTDPASITMNANQTRHVENIQYVKILLEIMIASVSQEEFSKASNLLKPTLKLSFCPHKSQKNDFLRENPMES